MTNGPCHKLVTRLIVDKLIYSSPLNLSPKSTSRSGSVKTESGTWGTANSIGDAGRRSTLAISMSASVCLNIIQRYQDRKNWQNDLQ